MGKYKLQLKILLAIKKVFFIGLLFLFNNVIAQNIVPTWIEQIYATTSNNIDSIKEAVYKQKQQKINLPTFKIFIEKLLTKDSSVNMKIKTIFVLKALLKNQDTAYYLDADYETRLYYTLLLLKIYIDIPQEKFENLENNYSSIYELLPPNFISDDITIDKRTLAFYKKYMPTKRLIGSNLMRYFRYANISAYNDLILEYILKSPDSVDFSKYTHLSMEYDFNKNIAWQAIYTLAWFNDIRVAPYLEKLGKTVGLGINTTFVKILLSPTILGQNAETKYDISLPLRLWFIKGVLQNKEIFKTIRIIDMFHDGIDIVPFDFYIIGHWVYGFFSVQYVSDYEKLQGMKSREAQYKYVENFINKKLKALDKK